jgi:hypothetical protein
LGTVPRSQELQLAEHLECFFLLFLFRDGAPEAFLSAGTSIAYESRILVEPLVLARFLFLEITRPFSIALDHTRSRISTRPLLCISGRLAGSQELSLNHPRNASGTFNERMKKKVGYSGSEAGFILTVGPVKIRLSKN